MLLNKDIMTNNILVNFVKFSEKINQLKNINNRLKFKQFITFKDRTKIFDLETIIRNSDYEVGIVFLLDDLIIILSTFLKKDIIYDLYNVDYFVYNIFINDELLYKEKFYYEVEIIFKSINSENFKT